VYPADKLSLSYHIVFPHRLIGSQSLEFVPGEGNTGRARGRASDYETEIAPARTFGFIEEVEKLRRNGLVRGGALENAVVLTRDGVMNPEGLRYPDEFCRHKLLDLIGDLAMLGTPLIGRVVAERAGHALHAALVARLWRERSGWTLVNSELVRPPLAVAPPLEVQAPQLP
jgi:UDP-3-O-[3-hydroxymyristoyl] N-acetylglucosamine deacetylase